MPRSVAARQFEHAVIERVEARQSHELEFVTHRADLALEFGDGRLSILASQLNEGEQL